MQTRECNKYTCKLKRVVQWDSTPFSELGCCVWIPLMYLTGFQDPSLLQGFLWPLGWISKCTVINIGLFSYWWPKAGLGWIKELVKSTSRTHQIHIVHCKIASTYWIVKKKLFILGKTLKSFCCILVSLSVVICGEEMVFICFYPP